MGSAAMKRCVAIFVPMAVAAAMQAAAADTSPYAGQQSRGIKALSDDEVSGLLAGKGMGLAKAAELNGYPGPLHVLVLSSQLGLSVEQRKATEALFASMQAKAVKAGTELVDEERRLDRLFAERAVTPDALSEALRRIASLQSEVRGAHLEAHLAQIRILTPQQSAMYVKLRGYGEASGVHEHGQHKH